MKHFIFYIFLLLFSYCHAQIDLKGQWLRIDDDINNPKAWKGENYDSTIIEVLDRDGSIIGIMLKVPQNAVDHGYSVGQIKWKNFKKIDDVTLEFEGLIMIHGPKKSYDVEKYIKVYMIMEDWNTIKLWVADDNGEIGGTKQKWIRLQSL